MKKIEDESYIKGLRERAAEFVKQNPSAIRKIPSGDVQSVIEDLQIHQIELEMQNEELRRTQLELEDARDKYLDLYDFAPVGYFTISDKGMILEANLTGADMLGVERGLLIGKPFSKFIDRNDQDIFYHHHRKLIATKDRQTCELRLVKKDGPRFHGHMESVHVLGEQGNLDQIRVAITDISERKGVEEALRESKEKYSLLFENASDAIFVTQDGVIEFPNPRALEMIGYTEEELRKIQFADLLHPEEREMVLERHRRRLAGDEDIPSMFSHRVINKAGDELIVNLNAVRIMWEGRPASLNFVRDITQHKELESQLQQAQKMEAIAILAGGVAHQFNNALCPITANLDLLEVDSANHENTSKCIEQMRGSAQRMVRLINQLLAYARGGRYQPEIILPNDLVRDSLPLIKHTLHSSIYIDTDLHKNTFPVETDITQMQMVLSAVLQNASDAIEGEGSIKISSKNQEIDENFSNYYPGLKPGSYVSLTIEDDGKGMDEETRSRIFEPFFTTKFHGRGLGMAAVYGIIKNHDGYITVDSEVNKGTVVRIFLPATEERVEKTKRS